MVTRQSSTVLGASEKYKNLLISAYLLHLILSLSLHLTFFYVVFGIDTPIAAFMLKAPNFVSINLL